MSQNKTLIGREDRKVKLLSKKFKSYGIELTFKMAEQYEHKLRIELHDDNGIAVDVYKDCLREFQTVIRPISEQHRLRIVIYEDQEVIYQITMRIPAHYKPLDDSGETREAFSEPAELVPQNSAEEEKPEVFAAESDACIINGDLEVDFRQISEQAVRMIDFKR